MTTQASDGTPRESEVERRLAIVDEKQRKLASLLLGRLEYLAPDDRRCLREIAGRA